MKEYSLEHPMFDHLILRSNLYHQHDPKNFKGQKFLQMHFLLLKLNPISIWKGEFRHSQASPPALKSQEDPSLNFDLILIFLLSIHSRTL